MADKMTKKELEQPDEFHTIGWHALQYVSEHKEKFYLAGAAVLLIIILLGSWHFYRLNYENKAQGLYSSAAILYSQPVTPAEMKDAYLKAIQIYDELAKEYPSSRAAKLSFYNLGNIYYNIGDTDNSITSYKTFLKKSWGKDTLNAFAYYGLGYCYEKNKDYDNALTSFENSNKHIQGTRFEYVNYANIARIYEQMGRQKEALEFYQKATGKMNDQLAEMVVKSRIAALTQ